MLTAPTHLYRWQDEKQTPVALVSEITFKFSIHNSLIATSFSLSLASPSAFLIKQREQPITLSCSLRWVNNVRDVLRCQPFQRCQVLQARVNDVNRHAEGFGDLLDGDVGHAHQFALLYAPDVLTSESGTVGEFLLADALQFAQGSDTLPHALCCLLLTHSFANTCSYVRRSCCAVGRLTVPIFPC